MANPQYSGDPCTCSVPTDTEIPYPDCAKYVRVTVCAPMTAVAPDLLGAYGFAIDGKVIRHTTTYRELIPLPGAALLMDTPGMRELQMWADEDSLHKAFDDVQQFALECKFRDCTHEAEPGCAVREALEDGALDTDRWQSYQKLQRELAYLARKQDQRAQRAEEDKWKAIAKWQKQLKRGDLP